MLNPAAFIPNPTGGYGNLGRNALRGPGYFGFDLSLSRNFKVTERFQPAGARRKRSTFLITRTCGSVRAGRTARRATYGTLTQASEFFDLRTDHWRL